MRDHVDVAWIETQRERGWPDIEPEDYCHRCGTRNILWCAPSEEWLAATSAWAAETGHEGICCVSCFTEMYREQTGTDPVWILTQWRGSWEAHAVPGQGGRRR